MLPSLPTSIVATGRPNPRRLATQMVSQVLWSLKIPWTIRTGRATWTLNDTQSIEVQENVFVFPVSMSIRMVFGCGTSGGNPRFEESSARGSGGKFTHSEGMTNVLSCQVPLAPDRNWVGTKWSLK